jgi:hypothetical protein
MPALGLTDPADLEAKARAELFFSRQLEQPQRVAPHPFLGGTGYPVWYGEQQLEKQQSTTLTRVKGPYSWAPVWQIEGKE